MTHSERTGGEARVDSERKGEDEGREIEKKSAYPWQLVDPIKADWLVNEAREARVLVPTGLFPLTPSLHSCCERQ